MNEVSFPVGDPRRLGEFVAADRLESLLDLGEQLRQALGGAAIVCVNSTASGGGVAEMLQMLLRYVRGVGIDVRWLVIDGDERFFAITKRLHNHLHGFAGDGGPLGGDEQASLPECWGRTQPSSPMRCDPATSCWSTIPSRRG